MSFFKVASLIFISLLLLLSCAAQSESRALTGPSWLNQSVFYEIFVRSFYDHDGDGIGDFKGLTEKLDYLNDGNPRTDKDLEIRGIWLMPMLESSSYHGYDVVDYYKIERDYGTGEDFQDFIAAAHKRGIKVIMDLVLNHTSSRHPWFIESCRAKASKEGGKADWYVWEDAIPQGWARPWGEGKSEDVWHYKDGYYYYAAFSADMPDLNYANKEVIGQIKMVIKYWLDKGIDGFRLDGARFLAEKSGGVSGQADLKETHEVLIELANYAKSINKECILAGEVWADNKIISAYYGQGDELDRVFNFDLAGAIISSINSNDYNKIEAVLQLMDKYNAPPDFYSPFLTNHDQNRVASELNGDTGKLKLAATLLLSIKGTPFIYYGEEIGMTGRDRHERIRTPMQWDDTKNAGFTTGKPWEELQDNFKRINVKSEELQKSSLLNYYKKLIRIMNKYCKLLDEGARRLLTADNEKIYAYAYVSDTENLLFIHNFNDTEARNVNLDIYNSGFVKKEYRAEDLLNIDGMKKEVAVQNPHRYTINYLERYGTLILKLKASR